MQSSQEKDVMSQVHEEIDYNEELPLEGMDQQNEAEAERAEEEIDPNELELECIEEADGTNGTMPVKRDKGRDRQRDRRPHSTRGEEDRSRRDRDRISHRRTAIQDRIKRPHQHHSSSSSHSTSSRSKLSTTRSEKNRASSQIDRDRRRREEHGLLKKRRMEGENGSSRHTHRHSHLASSSRSHAARTTRKTSPRRHESSRDRDRERQRERHRNDREHRETDGNRHRNRNKTEDLDAIDLNDLEAVDECSGDEDWNTASEPSESQSRTGSSASVSASASDESASEGEELFEFEEPDYAAMKKAAQNSQPTQLLPMYREALEREDEQAELPVMTETSCTNMDEELTRDSNASSSKQRLERERATTSSSTGGSSRRQQHVTPTPTASSRRRSPAARRATSPVTAGRAEERGKGGVRNEERRTTSKRAHEKHAMDGSEVEGKRSRKDEERGLTKSNERRAVNPDRAKETSAIDNRKHSHSIAKQHEQQATTIPSLLALEVAKPQHKPAESIPPPKKQPLPAVDRHKLPSLLNYSAKPPDPLEMRQFIVRIDTSRREKAQRAVILTPLLESAVPFTSSMSRHPPIIAPEPSSSTSKQSGSLPNGSATSKAVNHVNRQTGSSWRAGTGMGVGQSTSRQQSWNRPRKVHLSNRPNPYEEQSHVQSQPPFHHSHSRPHQNYRQQASETTITRTIIMKQNRKRYTN